ncbi:unnamed protein product, partial [Coregonus sp. 'balchen']
MIFVKSQSTFKIIEMKFKLNDTFEETTADNRKTMVDRFYFENCAKTELGRQIDNIRERGD